MEGRPTAEDIEGLYRHIDELNALDPQELERLRAEYHTAPPEPYDRALARTSIEPTRESIGTLEATIDADPELTSEQRHVLKNEAFERWQMVVVGQAGEGFND